MLISLVLAMIVAKNRQNTSDIPDGWKERKTKEGYSFLHQLI
jgi:hypothetical protein